MRALAAFIMRGRFQAGLVALAGNLVPLISPATVGLVALRRNLGDAALILLWAALPVFVVLYGGDVNVMVVALSLTSPATVAVAAQVLKASVSWQLTLLAVLTVSGLSTAALAGLVSADTQALVNQLRETMAAVEQGATEQIASLFVLFMAATALGLGVSQPDWIFAVGFLAWLTGVHAVGSILLARWWQALLYNPGGFQQEFHGLRLDKVVSGLLLAGIIACNLGDPAYMTWGSLLGVPLLVAGLGLAHHAVNFMQLGVHWLVIMYAGLVLVGPLSMVLIGVGFLDSFFDFRARLSARRKG